MIVNINSKHLQYGREKSIIYFSEKATFFAFLSGKNILIIFWSVKKRMLPSIRLEARSKTRKCRQLHCAESRASVTGLEVKEYVQIIIEIHSIRKEPLEVLQ